MGIGRTKQHTDLEAVKRFYLILFTRQPMPNRGLVNCLDPGLLCISLGDGVWEESDKSQAKPSPVVSPTRLAVGTQQRWRKLVPECYLLIWDATPQSPAFNRVRTLYYMHVYPVYLFLTLQARKKYNKFFFPPPLITLSLLVYACNCYISSRKIKHHRALLNALILQLP